MPYEVNKQKHPNKQLRTNRRRSKMCKDAKMPQCYTNQENILSFFVKRYKPASLFQSNQPEKNIYVSHPIPNPSISVAFSKATSTELTNKSAVCEVRGRRPGSFPTGEGWSLGSVLHFVGGRPPWNCHKLWGGKPSKQLFLVLYLSFKGGYSRYKERMHTLTGFFCKYQNNLMTHLPPCWDK